MAGTSVCHPLSNPIGSRTTHRITALAPTVRRVEAAETSLIGTDGGSQAALDAGQACSEACLPISDVRASAHYRRAMTAVVTRRAIEVAVMRARRYDVRVPASQSWFGSAGTTR